MYKLKIKKEKEKNLVGNTIRFYVDCVILVCCFIIAINIHPSNISNKSIDANDFYTSSESKKMIYIFHDYEGNEYIMNDNIHGSSSSWDYLFDDEVPDDLKGEKEEGSVSIGDLLENSDIYDDEPDEDDNNSNLVKDNQISIDDMMAELGIDTSENINKVISDNEENDNDDLSNADDNASELGIIDYETADDVTNDSDNSLSIDVGDYEHQNEAYNDYLYIVTEETGTDNNSLIIEKISDNGNVQISGNDNKALEYNENVVNNQDVQKDINIKYDKDDGLLPAKSFTFVEEGWILPTLVSWDDLFLGNSNQPLSYLNGNVSNNPSDNQYIKNESKESGITIIPDYEDCMTPWGYRIKHGESVLAYKQMDNAPDICNIERRFCWKGKLSGTYTQQGCSINKNYTYEQRGGSEATASKQSGVSNNSTAGQKDNVRNSSSTKDSIRGNTRQNEDGTVTVKNSEIGGSFVFDSPNNGYSDYAGKTDNIRPEDSEVEQTDRPYWDCTAPRGEKVIHGQFVQAFKHKNGFSDLPCEAQFRLCTMGDLMGTFTESSCKTWDTSFVDWVYGSPTRETYSEGKLKLVKEQMESDEKKYNRDRKKIGRLENDDDFDELLYILDDNY